MTYAEDVAAEHIGFRRACGWTWAQIMDEANACMVALGYRGWSCYRKPSDIRLALAWVFGKLQRQQVVA